MPFIANDRVVVKEGTRINPVYQGCKGTIVSWVNGPFYKVEVLGTQLILKEGEEMEKDNG